VSKKVGYAMSNSAQVKAARKLAKSGKTYAQVAKTLRLSSPKAAWCLVNNAA